MFPTTMNRQSAIFTGILWDKQLSWLQGEMELRRTVTLRALIINCYVPGPPLDAIHTNFFKSTFMRQEGNYEHWLGIWWHKGNFVIKTSTIAKSFSILETNKIFTIEIMFGICSPNHLGDSGGVRAHMEGEWQCSQWVMNKYYLKFTIMKVFFKNKLYLC